MRRIRAVSLRPLSIVLAALGFACLAAHDAQAAPIHYETTGDVGPAPGQPAIHFEGTQGTFEPGGPRFSLGQFAIDPPTAGVTTSYSNVPFTIEVRTPDLDRTIPPSSPGQLPTQIENSLIIKGHLLGSTNLMGINFVGARVDSTELGGLGPDPVGAVRNFEFPIPLSDLVLGKSYGWLVMIPTDGWAPDRTSEPFVRQISAQAVPEPSLTVAFLAGLGFLGLRRCRRR